MGIFKLVYIIPPSGFKIPWISLSDCPDCPGYS